MLQSIRILDSADARNVHEPLVEGGDPRTLSGLLLRAARLWPGNGIHFKDQGWEQASTFTSYAELLKEVQVRLVLRSV